MKIKSPKEFWAGLMFIAFGLFFLIVSMKSYQLGSAVRMGPGYFPAVLGGILAVLGLLTFFQGLTLEGPKVPKMHLRPIFFISLALILFGYLMKPLGFVIACVLLIVVSAFGGHEFRWKEVTLLSVLMVIFSVLVFVKGLTLPFPLWPAFLG
jgi:putative tricarboxylic transport membrane protein